MINFDPIAVPDISELIIMQILEKIRNGDINPGDQLPSEQIMQKLLNVTKPQIKNAFRKLEVYRVVTIKPQSGTYIIDINRKILIGLLENIISIKSDRNMLDIFEIRTVLELKAVEKAVLNCTAKELQELVVVNEAFRETDGIVGLGMEEDLFFHQEVVRFSHNSVILSLYSFVFLEFIEFWKGFRFKSKAVQKARVEQTYHEHKIILDAIAKRDVDAGVHAMQQHLDNVQLIIEEHLKEN